MTVIKEQDIRQDTFTAGNNIWVKLIHIPTGLSVEGKAVGIVKARKALRQELEQKVKEHSK